MTKILFQNDDFGLTDSTAAGIEKAIKQGITRNTGLFVNMPSSALAASKIKEMPQACFGIDFNIVAGKPVSEPKLIPDLVDENGYFLKSGVQIAKLKNKATDFRNWKFDEDPYPIDQVRTEFTAQLNKFIELVGHKPEYLHPHSLMTGNTIQVIRELSKEYDIPYSQDIAQELNLFQIPCDWTPRPFPIEKQLETNVEEHLLQVLPQTLEHEVSIFVCHAGMVEEDLFEHSTYTIIRIKDLAAMTSPKIQKWLKDNNVELITYRDLKEMKK